jgi:ADP-L-glycero-D-manno-heptose 6-epimerase
MILVTGGAGFIGSNLVAGLEERGLSDIVICDVLGSDDKWRNISKRELRDIVHPDRLFDYLQNHADEIEMIFHLGSVSSTTENDADLVIDSNFVLSRRVWKWCWKNNKRIVYASSYSTYGDGSKGFKDDEDPEILKQLMPLNPYGWSKHLFDRRIARVVKTKSEPLPPQWVGLKLFNVYGPNEYHKGEQQSVVCKLYPQAAAGAAARLFKSDHPDYQDGGQLRDFIWVDDVVDVMLWLYDNRQVSGLFNLGTGKARSFKELAEAMFKAAGKTPKITYVDMPVSLRDKYQYYTQADMQKLRAAGYTKPFTELEEGVMRYVRDYLSKADPYR